MAPYGDLHRVMLQTLMSRRAVEQETANELYRRAYLAVKGREFGSASVSKELQQLLQDLQNKIIKLDLDVRRFPEQNDTKRHWICLVNKRPLADANELSKAVSDLSPLEISYYREIVLQVVDSYPANSIGSKQALQTASGLDTPIPKTNAEALLRALVSRGWLAKSSRGRYSLGIRAIAELSDWLRETYGDPAEVDSILNSCSFKASKSIECKDLVLTGWKCEQPDCGAHIHHFCRSRMIKAKKSTCGACGQPFDPQAEGGIEMSPIGEDAVLEVDDNRVVASKRGKKRRSEAANGNGHGSEEPEASVGEEDSEDGDEVARQGKERGRASRRLASQVPVSQVEDSEADDSQEYESE